MCAVIASAVAASREIILLRLALSSMASLSYRAPTFNHTEDRLGKHDVAASPKLSRLIKVPASAFQFRFAAFEDIAHTIERWTIDRDARHAAAELLPNFHEGKTSGFGTRVLRKPCDEGVVMNASGGLATFSAQTPNCFLKMNPEIVRLSPHEREEHLDAHCIRQPFTFEREGREQLPINQGQGVDFGVHRFGLVLAFRPSYDGTASAQTTTKGHEFAHSYDNLFIQQLAGELALLVFA